MRPTSIPNVGRPAGSSPFAPCREWSWKKRSLASFGEWDRFAFVHEKDEFGAAYADRIAVVEELSSYGHSIHKGAVQAVEIDELKLLVYLLDRAVFPRDRGIDKTQLVRFVAANGYLTVGQLSNSTGRANLRWRGAAASSRPPMRVV